MKLKHPNAEHYVNMLNDEYERMKNKWNPRPLSLEEQFEALKEKWNKEQHQRQRLESIAEQFKLKPIPKIKNKKTKQISSRKKGKSKYG
tara:strand:+ start:522 stop:788 length:267 start_codon:yes stop_codon:yes gene_type:complete